MAKQKQSKHNRTKAGDLKTLFSISAITATLFGWGMFARGAMQIPPRDPPADIRAMVEGILGDLPELVSSGTAHEVRRSLRLVSLPSRSSSIPSPITRTQSSR